MRGTAMTADDQPNLFDSTPPALPSRSSRPSPASARSASPLPEGFKYQDDLIAPAEEQQFVRHIETLPLKEFEFQGFVGKRRVISFGWRYDFNDRRLQKVDDIPPFLLPLRDRAAAFAGLESAGFQHVLVTEYSPGAAIGWHRDKPMFAEVVGLSLLSPCRFRFRRQQPDGKWQRAAITAAPRSAYLLAGPARTEWEHSIPEVDALRYSITFRNFREG
jgi:alkylated DNA repair dioxygenase AlkB